MRICVFGVDQFKGRIHHLLPPYRIAERSKNLVDVGKIRLQCEIMLICQNNIVETAAKHDLTGLGDRRIEMPRADAFSVKGRALASGEISLDYLLRIELFVYQRLVPDWHASHRQAGDRLHPPR